MVMIILRKSPKVLYIDPEYYSGYVDRRPEEYVAYSAIPGFYYDFEFPANDLISMASCGGGSCYSNGLKKCVKCGSTGKGTKYDKSKKKSSSPPKCSKGNCYSKGKGKCVKCGSTSKNCSGGKCYSEGKKACVVCGSTSKTCGGKGQCYSDGLGKCVQCGSTAKGGTFSCDKTPQLCFANQPGASSCKVVTMKQGSCVCSCRDKLGKEFSPIKDKSNVKSESAPASSSWWNSTRTITW